MCDVKSRLGPYENKGLTAEPSAFRCRQTNQKEEDSTEYQLCPAPDDNSILSNERPPYRDDLLKQYTSNAPLPPRPMVNKLPALDRKSFVTSKNSVDEQVMAEAKGGLMYKFTSG